MSKVLLIDLDCSFFRTDSYVLNILKANKVSELGYNVNDVYKLIEEMLVDYDVVERLSGADDCLNLLKTEYRVVFVGSPHSDNELKAKQDIANELGVTYYSIFNRVDLEEILTGYYVEDEIFYVGSNISHFTDVIPADNQFLLNNNYQEDLKYVVNDIISAESSFNGRFVVDWYELTDILLNFKGVDDDVKFRKRIQEGIFEKYTKHQCEEHQCSSVA